MCMKVLPKSINFMLAVFIHHADRGGTHATRVRTAVLGSDQVSDKFKQSKSAACTFHTTDSSDGCCSTAQPSQNSKTPCI